MSSLGSELGNELGGSNNAVSGSGQAFWGVARSILGPNAIEVWDAQYGLTVVSGGADAWLGQISGIILPASTLGTGPTYTAHDANFGGYPSLKGGASRHMRATGLATVMASGSKPYIWAVARFTALLTDAASHILIDYGVAATSDDAKLNSGGTVVTGDLRWTTQSNPATEAKTLVVTTSPMFVEGWCDSGGTNHLAIAGVDVATGLLAAGVNHAISAIGLFVAASTAGVQASTMAVAAHGCCVAVPTATERAALYSASKQYGT